MPLVHAYAQCTAPNSTHVAPIALPSCSPAVLESNITTSGTTGTYVGFAKLTVFCQPPETTPPCSPTDGQEERHRGGLIGHRSPLQDRRSAGCSAAGADYTGPVVCHDSHHTNTRKDSSVLLAQRYGRTDCVTRVLTRTRDPGPARTRAARKAPLAQRHHKRNEGRRKSAPARIVSVFG